jgi:Glycosyltransferase family 87
MSAPGQPRDVFRDVSRPGVIASAVLLLLYLATVKWGARFPEDIHRYVLGRDFLNFWSYGHAAWSANPGRFFDIATYNHYLDALTGWNYQPQQWSYPPHLMLLMAPFGLLPYLTAYLLWTALGLAALYWAVRADFADGKSFAILVLAPAGFIGLISGQNCFLSAALLIAVFRFLDTRPIVAGLLLGLLTMKPQLGLLFPLMLILTGRWKVFFSAAATACALIGATTLIWGVDIWHSYFALGVPLQEQVIGHPTVMTQALMPTVYMNARLLGLSATAAYAIQCAAGVAAIAAVVWTYRKRRDPLLSYALLIVAGFLATPYLMSYDLVIAGWLTLMLWKGPQASRSERGLFMAFYLLPFAGIALAMIGLPGSALVLVALAAWLVRRMMQQDEPAHAGAAVGAAL